MDANFSSEKDVEMDARSDNARQTSESAAGIVDLDAALERMGGDRQLLEDIVQFYFQDSPGLLQQIERSISARDSAQLERAAHSLKGLAANFGAASVVETTASLEGFGRESQFDEAPALLEMLQARIAVLNRELSAQFKTSENLG